MNRRRFIAALGLSLLASPAGAEVQPAGKLPRLCFLTLEPGTAQSPSARFDVFFQSLRDLG